MFERPQVGERAVLVHVQFKHEPNHADLREFKELVRAAGAQPIELVTAVRQKPDPKYYIGEGKIEDLQFIVESEEIDLVIFDHDLSPAQERNVEKFLKCRVLSRTGLILDIFAQRARTYEGKLQVELAQLQHLSTRLVRGWTHLERQKGGIGLRGPGETQLETDRRLVRQRIQYIKDRLEKVRLQRQQSRKKRQKAQWVTVSLVGYTNAGKSTLFNALTGADVLVENKLFATLDPTIRMIKLPEVGKVVMADTVGFVSRLPHDLVNAFRATLEETREATLLLHVVDRHDPRYGDTMHEVNQVLEEIGAGDVPQLVVYNKIDLSESLHNKLGTIEVDSDGKPIAVWISALTGVGLDKLCVAIQKRLATDMVQGTFELASNLASIRAHLYEIGAVLEEEVLETGWRLHVKLPKDQWQQMCHSEPLLKNLLPNCILDEEQNHGLE